jgi:hypothetical protein
MQNPQHILVNFCRKFFPAVVASSNDLTIIQVNLIRIIIASTVLANVASDDWAEIQRQRHFSQTSTDCKFLEQGFSFDVSKFNCKNFLIIK